MTPYQNIELQHKLDQWSKRFSIAIIILGILVLIGWQFNIEVFKRPIPKHVAMNPLTALMFILCGFCLLISNSAKKNRKLSIDITLISIVIMLIGSIKLISIIIGFDLPIDSYLFHSKVESEYFENIPNKMAPNTAFNFFLAGTVLFMMNYETVKYQVLAQFMTLGTLFIGLLSILGYLYKVDSFYGIFTYIPMAFHTAIAFVFLALGILFVNSDKGIMRNFTSTYAGSTSARFFVPAAIIIPALLGYLRLLGDWAGLYSKEFGVAILILSIIIIFLFLIWYNTTSLNKKDALKKEAEEKLRQLNSHLEQKVEERTKEIAELNYDLEKKVYERTKQLELVNKELDSFGYSISHDLRAPLRAINGYSKMIEEDYGKVLDDEGKRLLTTIQYNAQKMGNLIDDLLSFSRLGRKDLKKSDLDILELVEGAISEISKTSPHHADIKIEKLENSKGDYALINQVFHNLIANAIKYSSKIEHPIIQISSEKNENEIVYCISDNGVGFDMKYSDKLFGVFQRLHTNEDFEGTGVGLAIVQRIIFKHGGKVWATAKTNEGASFYFSLPLS